MIDTWCPVGIRQECTIPSRLLEQQRWSMSSALHELLRIHSDIFAETPTAVLEIFSTHPPPCPTPEPWHAPVADGQAFSPGGSCAARVRYPSRGAVESTDNSHRLRLPRTRLYQTCAYCDDQPPRGPAKWRPCTCRSARR